MTRQQKLRQLLQFDRKLQLQQRLKNLTSLAGVDEAGRGPLAGPVVAGAAMIRNPQFTVSINDSKKLTPGQRRKAFRAILSNAWVGVGSASHEEIDRFGIHVASHMAMVRALAALPVKPELVLIDGKFLPAHCPYPAIPVIKGDAKSLSIACGSIVAKVIRDRWMRMLHKIHPEYGFYRHKGYTTSKHLRVLKEIGPCAFHRYSFQPVYGYESITAGQEL